MKGDNQLIFLWHSLFLADNTPEKEESFFNSTTAFGSRRLAKRAVRKTKSEDDVGLDHTISGDLIATINVHEIFCYFYLLYLNVIIFDTSQVR